MMFDPANFFPVLPEQITAARPYLEPFLREFDALTRLVTAEDVLQRAECGETQLWTYHDGDKFVGVLGTRLFETSLGRICNLYLILGHDVEPLLRGGYALVERWARDSGCYAMEIVGRPGWQKVLPGFQRKAVVLEKFIAEVH